MRRINQHEICAGVLKPHYNPGNPLTVDGCLICQCIKGFATFTVNFKNYTIEEGDVLFFLNEMVIETGEKSSDFEIRYVNVTAEKIFEIYLSVPSTAMWYTIFSQPLRKFSWEGRNQFDRWINLCVYVNTVTSRDTREKILFNLVTSLYLLQEERYRSLSETAETQIKNSPWKITGEFFLLLSRHYRTEHKVAFYADSLNITSDYLGAVLKKTIGVSPKEAIEHKLVLAMKNLLESTSMPVKGITHHLNYEDSSHLCRVFRRHEGISPLAYRRLKT